MFCAECGNPVSEGSHFCPSCGARINYSPVSAEQNDGDDVQAVAIQMSENGLKKDETLSKKHSGNKARMVSFSSDDRETNHKLFDLYSMLITPVEAVEVLERQKEILRRETEYAKNNHFSSYILSFIIFAILSYIILFPKYPYWWTYSTLYSPDEISVFWWPVREIIADPYASNHMQALFLYPLAVALVMVILLSIISNILYKRSAKSTEKKNSKKIEELDGQQKQVIEAIAPYIGYVPPNYRTSERLRFFVDSYENCKVDNLKEAVLLCDKAEFRAEAIRSLQVVGYKLNEIDSQLSDIDHSLDLLHTEAGFIAAASLANTIVNFSH